jgi:hypothetical protein
MFQSLYDSIWNVPIAPWVSAALVLVWCLSRSGRARPFAARYGAVFALSIAADGWLGGPLTPLAQGSAAATASGVVFVVAGDLRYFIAVERLVRGALDGRALWTALGLSAIVPAASEVFRRVAAGAELRVVFLAYEVLFFLMVLALRARVLPRRLLRAQDPVRRAVLALTAFELLQYGLWAGADAVVLATASDAGFAVRLAANFMYYTLFVPFALWQMKRVDP